MSKEEKFKILLSQLSEYFQEEKPSTSIGDLPQKFDECVNKVRDEKKFKNLLLELEKIFQEEKKSSSRNCLIHKFEVFVKSIQAETVQVNNFCFLSCHTNNYLYTNLPVNDIFILLYPRSRDSKGQETFLTPSINIYIKTCSKSVLHLGNTS